MKHRRVSVLCIAAGVAALALSGCAGAAPTVRTLPAGAASARPTTSPLASDATSAHPLAVDTATPLPDGSYAPRTPASVAPAPVGPAAPAPTVPPAPALHVPTTCKALVPLSAIVDDAGEIVDPTDFVRGLTPPSFADDRNGALRCLWAGYDVYDPATAAIEISIVPRVARDVFDAYRAGIGWPETASSAAPDAYTYCRTAGQLCGFHEFTPDYAIVGFAWNLHTKPPAEVQASAEDLLRRVNSLVATLPAPKP